MIDFANYEPEGREFESLRAHHFSLVFEDHQQKVYPRFTFGGRKHLFKTQRDTCARLCADEESPMNMKVINLGTVNKCTNPETDCANVPDPASSYTVVYKGKPLVLYKVCGPEFQRKAMLENR